VRIVLDTNVLISGTLNPNGFPGTVLNAVLEGEVVVLVDDRILFEYRDVLLRPKFSFPLDYVQSVLEFFEHEGDYITAGPASDIVVDSDDVPFFEVAVAGPADYLVTGNERHFPDKPFVVSPKEFVSILRSIR